MRLVIEKYTEYDTGHMLLCTPINTDGATLSQSELMDEVRKAFRDLRCLYGEYGHPHKQAGQSNKDYLNRCLMVDEFQICISYQGFSETRDNQIVIHFDFAGGQKAVFEEALRNNAVDLGSRVIITDPLTYIAFDVIQKLN